MLHAHDQEEAASVEAIQAVLLTSDLFGVRFQQLSALRNSPPLESARGQYRPSQHGRCQSSTL
ncbi:hypothetical protein FOA52_004746 [Chlamydomonas sp. UWO 241]|nr:hypothetical protein FOA52_004746 [Chlamydomonas sp. UWO 241]